MEIISSTRVPRPALSQSHCKRKKQASLSTWDALAEYFDAQVKKGALRKMESKLPATHFMGLLTFEMMMMLRSLACLVSRPPKSSPSGVGRP
jgi:hypothetical protein